jgi:hypothetical protein
MQEAYLLCFLNLCKVEIQKTLSLFYMVPHVTP